MEAEHWEGPPRFGQLVCLEELASHLADESFIRQATRRDSGRGRSCSDVQLHKRSIGAEHVQLMICCLVRLTTIRVRHGTSSLGGKVTHVGHQGSHFMTVINLRTLSTMTQQRRLVCSSRSLIPRTRTTSSQQGPPLQHTARQCSQPTPRHTAESSRRLLSLQNSGTEFLEILTPHL